MVSGPIFRCLIHFDFIFVYGVRKCSSFILMQVVDQFSQHHLLKRLSFFSLYILASFVKTLSDINHSRILYDPPPKVMEIKAKINKWDLIKLKSFCTMKQGEKTAYRMGENNCKLSNWQRINFKNIQAAPVAQFQKNKPPNQKIGQRIKQTFFQRRYTNS